MPNHPNPELRDVPDDAVLQRARETLMRSLVGLRHDHPAHARIGEALRWIDGGVYGGCSICARPLPIAQILATPADKTCAACRTLARAYADDAVARQTA